MPMGRIRHMFPGGNTSQGFFSYYHYILPQEEARRIFIIKGGPGVGKSTFMKKIGQEMVSRGYDVEHMHCSSDNNSLDGLVIPALKVALIDGTAPHVVDPKNPGAVDEIIHLGDYWDETGMVRNRAAILRTNREVGRLFARAYRYIKAAASVYEDSGVIHGWALNHGKLNKLGDEWVRELFADTPVADAVGKMRCLFASAITPDGYKNYLDSIINTEKVYEIKGEQGTGTEKLLEKLKQAAVERGVAVECYYCPLHPEKLEHLVIPGLDVSFTTHNPYHQVDIAKYRKIDLGAFLDDRILEDYKDVLEFNRGEFDHLMTAAIRTIGKAKAIHDDMEKYYIPNMDFEAVQQCLEATLDRILGYMEE